MSNWNFNSYVWADSSLTTDFFTYSSIANFTVNDNTLSGTTTTSTGNFYYTGTSGSSFSFEFTRTQSSYSRYILEIPSSASIDNYSVSDGITLSGRQFIIESGVTSGTVSVKFTQSNSGYVNFSGAGNASSFGSNNFAFTFTEFVVDGITYIGGNASLKYPFTLQNGYLFVYDLGSSSSSYSFDLSSKSEEYSNIGSNPFPDTNQSYWFSDTLPEIDETTIPASGAAIINWSKGDNTNIFGQTQNMVASISGTSAGRYLYIYNPPVHYKWSGSSNPSASEVVNYPMTINGVSDNDTWYIYDSIARLTDFNQGGTVSGTITGEQIIGTVTSDGAVSLNTSSGAIYTQNSGGSTDISGANGGSIAENINGLKQTLDNFVNQFIQLLSAPISHIQQLIQSGSSFFEVFSGLFDWLPSEVSAVIISGLIIMVVVGVLKMFL